MHDDLSKKNYNIHLCTFEYLSLWFVMCWTKGQNRWTRRRGGTERERSGTNWESGEIFVVGATKRENREAKSLDIFLRGLKNKGNIIVSGHSQWKFDIKKKNLWKLLINDRVVQTHKAINAEIEWIQFRVSGILDFIEWSCRLLQNNFVFLFPYFLSILPNCKINECV